MSEAVGIGNVLKEPQAVQNVVLDLLVVGQDVHIRQPEASGPAGEIRGRFPFLLRLNINPVCGIHGARADAHHHTLIVFQQPAQTEFLKEHVLRGYVSARQNDEITLPDQHLGIVLISPVQHLEIGKFDSGLGKGPGHFLPNPIRQLRTVRI